MVRYVLPDRVRKALDNEPGESTRSSSPFCCLLLLCGVLFAVVGCAEEEPTVERPSSTQYIVPTAGEGIHLASNTETTISIRSGEEQPEPQISLPDSYLVSQVINRNLDVDETDEQIIVYKNSDSGNDNISLLIADFDTVRSSFVRAWEGTTGANNVRSFAVYVNDLVGDHKQELVAFGMDNDGNQTLDVFRRVNSPSGFGVNYESVASLSANANIEIEEQERSEAYDNMQTSGQSFPIAVYNRAPNSTNNHDLVKTSYYWSHQSNRYVEGEIEQIPGGQIEEQQLQQLYDGNAEQIEQYLAGPWYRTAGPENEDNVRELAHFDMEERRISLHSGDSQKSYNWLNSYKTIYREGPGVWINVRNESIETLRLQFSVAVLSIDTISITVESEPSWNGTYKRMSQSLQESVLASSTNGPVHMPDLSLTGLYGNEAGTEIFFSSRSRFTMRREGETSSGGYSLYELRGEEEAHLVLELLTLNENGLATESAIYAVEHTTQETENRIVRTLELTPVTIRVDGVSERDGEELTLEQIEEKEPEEEESEGNSTAQRAPAD